MSERTNPGVTLFGGYFNKDESENTGVGHINRDLYDWAIAMIHHPLNFQPSTPEPARHMHGLLEHARWLIDRVRDGTLDVEVPPTKGSNPDG